MSISMYTKEILLKHLFNSQHHSRHKKLTFFKIIMAKYTSGVFSKQNITPRYYYNRRIKIFPLKEETNLNCLRKLTPN